MEAGSARGRICGDDPIADLPRSPGVGANGLPTLGHDARQFVTEDAWRSQHPCVIPSPEDLEVGATSQRRLDAKAHFARTEWQLWNLFNSDIFFPMKDSSTHDAKSFRDCWLAVQGEVPAGLGLSDVHPMELITKFIEIILHLQDHLNSLLMEFGPWFYALLFLIIFCETGLVVTPFLPGDSLLFAVGALAADPKSGLSLGLCALVIGSAAFLGDNVNYWLGKLVGRQLVKRFPNLIKQSHLDRTNAFFTKYGGKTIILARFVPIVRTFTPFVAGLGAMGYQRFIGLSVLSTALWVGMILPCGYFFGNLPVVKKHFELIVLGIIFISVLPMVFEWIKIRRQRSKV
jgi:membrane-associated protein